ncbi:MAG: DUF58 domain-containing protein [Acidimicrobiia bacterium]
MNGPGELTLTSIVLFTLGAYGIAAGAATGEQGVVAVGVFAFALFVLGIIWPTVMLSGVEIDAWVPADGMVGQSHDVHVRLHGRVDRVELRVLDPQGQWWVTASPASGVIPRIPTRRGVCSSLRIELRTSAPLGVFVRSRVLRVQLPTEQAVAPRPSAATTASETTPHRLYEQMADAAISVTSTAVPGTGDSVRAVRPYVPGDPARLVHWPTSARRGTLVVREHEPPAAVGVALVVDLNSSEDIEAIASRAAGIGRATLAAGGAVWCCTSEVTGPVSVRVVDTRDLGRRLARAGTGPVGAPPAGWPVVTVRA